MELTATKKVTERTTRAETDKSATTSRGRRPAKQVRSGLDATAELYYNAEQSEDKLELPPQGQVATEKEVSPMQKDGLELQEQQPAADVLAVETTEEDTKDQSEAGEEEPDKHIETVCVPLRDMVVLISTKADMIEQYETLAKSLGAKVSQPHHDTNHPHTQPVGPLTRLCCVGCVQVVRRLTKQVSHVVWDGQTLLLRMLLTTLPDPLASCWLTER